MPSRGPSNLLLLLSARFSGECAVNPFGKPKRPVATFMTASLSPLQQQASKKKLSKIHLRKMSGPRSKLVSSPDQNHHCQKMNTHTNDSKNSPLFSFFFFLLCFMCKFCFPLLAELLLLLWGYFFCFGTTFSRIWNHF